MSERKRMVIGTRGSRLAIAQTDIFLQAFREVAPDIEVETRIVKTTGDNVRDKPLKSLGGLGAFTKELDAQILEGGIDVAVNSLKDMPVQLTPGTTIAAVLPRGPVEDVLISKFPLDGLPKGAVVGTSSVRRGALVRRIRPDLVVKDLRGNVPTRIRKQQEGSYDAIILAKAGLERVGAEVSGFTLDPSVFVPPAGQGAISIVCKKGSRYEEVLRRVDDPKTRAEVEAERRVLAHLGGGCYVPIGVLARVSDVGLRIKANILDEQSDRFVELERVLPTTTGDLEGELLRFSMDVKEEWDNVKANDIGNDDRCPPRGEVYLVGAGPGDPSLMTLKGMELLRSAEVVVHDALIDAGMLKDAAAGAEIIDVGKRGGNHKAEQSEINRILLQKAVEGKKVVRLKGGDPFLFGRGGEEAEFLKNNGVAVHVVPGVTSAIAAPALAGIPVTHRDYASKVTIVTGHEGSNKSGKMGSGEECSGGTADGVEWERLAKLDGTLIILMGISTLADNMKRLMDGGLDPRTPAAVIESGTMPQQRTVSGTVSDIAVSCSQSGIMPPAVIIIGEVAKLRETLGDLN